MSFGIVAAEDAYFFFLFYVHLSSRGIEKIVWDASGERLAVCYRDGDELYKGLIAIYDVKRTPLISASLV